MRIGRKMVVGHQIAREVAFVGPYGVGKTTAVRAISNVPVASTEVQTSISFAARRLAGQKTTTTVGLDYGEWRGPAGTVAIYGTPGQARFRTDRDRLVPPTTSLVLWLYGQTDYALGEAEEWLRFLNARNSSGRLTVAVTRLEIPGGPPLEEYRPLLDSFDPRIGLIAADPREPHDVARTVLTALGLPVSLVGQ